VAIAQGAARIVRLHPCRVVLRAMAGAPLAQRAALQRQKTATRRTLVVALAAAGGQPAGRGWVHA